MRIKKVKSARTKIFIKRLWSVGKGCLITLGGMVTVMIILAFTSIPFWIWYGMGTKTAGINRPPDYIVLLGGGGMPSESGLMRTWYGAKVAGYYSAAKIIIALPGDTTDTLSAVYLMKDELVLRGIASERILFEDTGTNTRSQALNIYHSLSTAEHRISDSNGKQSSIANRQPSILLVTSPEHMYRAVLAFKKAGFLKVDGVPAFEQAIESDITFNAGKLGGRKFIPDVGSNISLRYQFWRQMNYELLILREWAATGYYKLNGWI